MNAEAQAYWNLFWQGKVMPQSVSAWQFGGSPNELAKLVVDRVKTATCSGHIFYELEKEPLPQVDDYSVVLNSKEEPVCIIRTSSVVIMPMKEVPESFAFSEGEGNRSYEYWRNVHIEFFTNELIRIGLEFSEDMQLVCERFELIDVRK